MGFKNKDLSAKDRIVLALDTDSLEEVERLVKLLKDYVGYFKVGPQLFTSCAYDAIDLIKKLGGEIYFDGKFHDIPSTVAKASSNLIKRGVTTFSAHLAGGSKMLTTTVKVAKETAKKYNMPTPTILGVTLLSSFGQRTLTEELNVKNIQFIDNHIFDGCYKLKQIIFENGSDKYKIENDAIVDINEKIGLKIYVITK